MSYKTASDFLVLGIVMQGFAIAVFAAIHAASIVSPALVVLGTFVSMLAILSDLVGVAIWMLKLKGE